MSQRNSAIKYKIGIPDYSELYEIPSAARQSHYSSGHTETTSDNLLAILDTDSFNGTSYYDDKKRIYEFLKSLSSIEPVNVSAYTAVHRIDERELLRFLDSYEFDDDSAAMIWNYLGKLIASFSLEYVGRTFLKMIKNGNMSPQAECAIASYLCSYDSEEAYPWGGEILDILLESDNENIIEYAAILVDNWHESSFIPKLKQSLEKIESNWLRSFIERVLQNLA